MRIASLILCLLLTVGCTQPSGEGKKPIKPAPSKETRLEQLAFESFQKRDELRAKNLRELRNIRFDAKRMEAIAEAGSKASIESWKPVAEELAKRLDSVPQTDQESFNAVLDELAKAADRASK